MLVRIRWNNHRTEDIPRFQSLALAVASLLAPSALMAFTISVWNLAAHLRWTADFFVSRGLFSHWQVWLFAAALLLLLAWLLNRYARSEEDYMK